VGGVYLNSLMLAMICGAVTLIFADRSRRSILVAISVIVGIAATGQALKQVSWTEAAGDPVSVTMVQGNIAQELKFQPNLIEDSLRTYADLSNTGSELVIWPESAIPTFFSDVALWEEEFATKMAEQGSTVLSGGFHANEDYTKFYNAIKVLGDEDAPIYTKRRLVPFGEYFPFRGLLSALERFVEIPMSDLSSRQEPAEPIEINGVKYAMSICYEDAFGSEMLEQFPEANVLINISNDAWFGDSRAPHQHQEIAAMRALEFQRFMLRATNTGITSLIGKDGVVKTSAEQSTTEISVEVRPQDGITPYISLRNNLVLCISMLMLLVGCAGIPAPNLSQPR
jgi:apolipoprotein N-acyltransferase